MKNSLFEALMSFFEKTLTQMKLAKLQDGSQLQENHDNEAEFTEDFNLSHLVIRAAKKESFRIFTLNEQFKLTKTSYQFIIRLMQLDIITSEVIENIINQLMTSDSPFVTLDETKWIVRNILEECLNTDEFMWVDNIITKQQVYYH